MATDDYGGDYDYYDYDEKDLKYQYEDEYGGDLYEDETIFDRYAEAGRTTIILVALVVTVCVFWICCQLALCYKCCGFYCSLCWGSCLSMYDTCRGIDPTYRVMKKAAAKMGLKMPNYKSYKMWRTQVSRLGLDAALDHF